MIKSRRLVPRMFTLCQHALNVHATLQDNLYICDGCSGGCPQPDAKFWDAHRRASFDSVPGSEEDE